jgi:hypothetical protein
MRDLSEDRRRAVWRWLKANEPELAQLLATDPFVLAARDQLGASPRIPRHMVDQALAVVDAPQQQQPQQQEFPS